MSGVTHTHYSPYEPPYQVPGTLLSCLASVSHSARSSEISADYAYAPQLAPSAATGLPEEVERAVLAAFMQHRYADVRAAITEASRIDAGYVVEITIRRPDNSGWHTEEYIHTSNGVERVVPNPHPGYDHTPPWCPNCGY